MKTTKVSTHERPTAIQKYVMKLAKALLLFSIIVFSLNGCTESVEDGLPGSESGPNYYHSTGWKDKHGSHYYINQKNCKACHGEDLEGGPSGVSCAACHHGWSGTHADAFNEDPDSCQACHGDSIGSCADCHHSGWTGTHGEEYASDPDSCKACHGEDLNGEGDQDRDCGHCHHEDAVGGWQHGNYHVLPDTDNCTDCHGADFTGGNSLVSCFSCHSGISAFDCSDCHTGAATSYTDSAHGNTSYGVDRSGTGYAQGDCTHCHDLPAGSTHDLLLFGPMNPTSQTDNFCFQCHKVTGSVQTSMPEQYSYSYMASGDTSITCPDNILEAFSFIDDSGSSVLNCGSTYGTSHMLADIQTFITDKWGYTADSNPCTACHNPHPAQRDLHTAGNRGWPVSLPSDHTDTSTWELWGDDDTERMKQYVTDQGGIYQAPEAASGYEPDGSDTTDGSNLTDYVTFCTDCHTSTPDSVWSTILDGWLEPINWDTETHGCENGNAVISSPYTSGDNFVLACTDCHEPHGSPNIFLTRQKVNKGDVSVSTSLGNEWSSLCAKCHANISSSHHTEELLDPMCSECHPPGGATIYQDCTYCHYHGSTFTFGTYDNYPLF